MGLSARVRGENRERYVVELRAGHHELISDEPEGSGGSDRGANPFGLMVAGLGSCTAITLRMYAERKEWPLTATRVSLLMFREPEGDRIERLIEVEGDLDEAQLTRLSEIAEKTPVTVVLKRAVQMETRLVAAGAAAE
jgi:putative redox protein